MASPIFENDAVSIGSGEPAAPPFYTRAQNVLIINILLFISFLFLQPFKRRRDGGKKMFLQMFWLPFYYPKGERERRKKKIEKKILIVNKQNILLFHPLELSVRGSEENWERLVWGIMWPSSLHLGSRGDDSTMIHPKSIDDEFISSFERLDALLDICLLLYVCVCVEIRHWQNKEGPFESCFFSRKYKHRSMIWKPINLTRHLLVL